MKALGIKPDFPTVQVTRWAQLFCETLLLADAILLRCGRNSKGDGRERLKAALKRLLFTAADPNTTGRAASPFSSVHSIPSKLLYSSSLASQTKTHFHFLSVNIHLIFQNRTRGFQRKNYITFVQTKWGPSL